MTSDSPVARPDSTPEITVQRLFEDRCETLQLENLTSDIGLERRVLDSDLSSPGLALAGYTERFASDRIQVFGETEIAYLEGLAPEARRDRINGIFSFGVPAVFVTKGQQVAQYFLDEAASAGVPVLRCSVSTKEFYRRIKPFLELTMAPTTTLHGSLADVYGVGLLFVGDSGVGKSECVLDLVERGHRLVADDLVLASKQGNDVLIGRGHELQRTHSTAPLRW